MPLLLALFSFMLLTEFHYFDLFQDDRYELNTLKTYLQTYSADVVMGARAAHDL